MNKIVSNEEKEKKENRNRKIIVVVIAVIMLVSTLGYSFMGFGSNGTKTKEEYNGIDFELQEDGWHFTIQGINFVTSYLPEETKNISADILINIQDYAGKPLYFSSDSAYEGVKEVQNNLYSIAERMQYACLDDNCSSYAIKNCSIDNILLINPGNETFISQEDNCIFITASINEAARASDRFLFKIFGII